MNETQLEAMVVRLYGDASSYRASMTEATQSSQQAAAQIEQYTSRVESFGASIQGFASLAMQSLGALGAASFLKGAFGQFAEHETTLIRLKAAVTGNGGAVEAVLPQYEAFARAQKDIAGLSADTTLNLLRSAESYRLSGDAAVKASQEAIALSFATRGNAEASEHMIRLTAAMAQGNIHLAQQMGRLVPQLRQFHGDTAGFQAAYQRLITTGIATASDVMNSATGVVQRYSMAWTALTKQFGQFVAEAAVPVIKYLTDLINGFTKLDEGTKRILVAAAFVATAILSIAPAIGIISSVLGPIIGLFTSGFGIIAAGAGLLLSPFVLIKGVLIGLAVVVGAVFSPIGVAIAAVSVVLLGLYRRAGSLSEVWGIIRDKALGAWAVIKEYAGIAWDWIKGKALAFYEWIGPIADATGSLVVTSWQLIKTIALTVWDAIKYAAGVAWIYIRSVWAGIFGDAQVDWAKIQDYIQRTIFAVEFAVLNFKQVWDVSWAYMKLKVAEAINAMGLSLRPFINSLATVFGALGDTRTQLQLLNTFGGTNAQTIAILRREYDALSHVLSISFESFVALRRAEYAARTGLSPSSPAVTGTGMIASNMQAAAKAAHEFNSVLLGSRETLYRLQAYQNIIQPTPGGNAAVGISSAAAGSSFSGVNLTPTNGILLQIRDALIRQGGALVQPSNLGGGGNW